MAILDETGAVRDVVVENGAFVGDPAATVEVVTLSFLAGGGDGYPFEALALERVDLEQPEEAPRTGVADIVPDGTEQDALAGLLAAAFTDEPFAVAETPAAEDRRIQNLDEVPADTVLDGVASLQLADVLDLGGPVPEVATAAATDAETPLGNVETADPAGEAGPVVADVSTEMASILVPADDTAV